MFLLGICALLTSSVDRMPWSKAVLTSIWFPAVPHKTSHLVGSLQRAASTQQHRKISWSQPVRPVRGRTIVSGRVVFAQRSKNQNRWFLHICFRKVWTLCEFRHVQLTVVSLLTDTTFQRQSPAPTRSRRRSFDPSVNTVKESWTLTLSLVAPINDCIILHLGKYTHQSFMAATRLLLCITEAWLISMNRNGKLGVNEALEGETFARL